MLGIALFNYSNHQIFGSSKKHIHWVVGFLAQVAARLQDLRKRPCGVYHIDVPETYAAWQGQVDGVTKKGLPPSKYGVFRKLQAFFLRKKGGTVELVESYEKLLAAAD